MKYFFDHAVSLLEVAVSLDMFWKSRSTLIIRRLKWLKSKKTDSWFQFTVLVLTKYLLNRCEMEMDSWKIKLEYESVNNATKHHSSVDNKSTTKSTIKRVTTNLMKPQATLPFLSNWKFGTKRKHTICQTNIMYRSNIEWQNEWRIRMFEKYLFYGRMEKYVCWKSNNIWDIQCGHDQPGYFENT